MINHENFTCSQCKKVYSKLEIFPNDICVDCWEHNTKDEPLKKPDFTRAIKIKW